MFFVLPSGPALAHFRRPSPAPLPDYCASLSETRKSFSLYQRFDSFTKSNYYFILDKKNNVGLSKRSVNILSCMSRLQNLVNSQKNGSHPLFINDADEFLSRVIPGSCRASGRILAHFHRLRVLLSEMSF